MVFSVSPPLGDLYGGVVLTLSVLGTVSGVTVGGVACTSVSQVGSTVTCTTPQTTAGLKDVIVSGQGGSSDPLVAAYEAWHPTVDYPAARVYQADQGVTSASNATRHRAGVQNQDTGIRALDPSVLAPLDGQGFVELANGRWLIAGGAPAGHAANVVNTIWYSDDKGKTWGVLLADGTPSSTRPARAHTFGFFTLTISGTEYVYWLGGDPFTPTGDVFRSSDGGSTWTRISTTCPTSGLALFNYGVLNGVIYVMGGQTSIQDTGVVSNTVYKSTDYGVTWTTVGNAPWTGRGAQLGPMPVMNGKLWLVAGARYHSTDATSWYNDVWSYDGTTWTQVLANGHGQFAKCRYHSVVLHQGKLWRFNGSTSNGSTITSDTATAHYSSDGATWTAWTDLLPWGNTHAQAAIANSTGIFLTEGLQTARLHVIREHTGAIVSAWTDRGSGAKTLSQSTDGKKPILDTAAFGAQAGLVFTRGQVLTLAAPDRDIAGGVFEAYVIAKTLNFDEQSTQGTNPPQTFVGSVNGSSWNNFGVGSITHTITGATNATPIVITTSAAHNLATGHKVTVAGVLGNTAANGKWTVTVLSSTTFSLDGSVGNGAYTSGGTVNVSLLRHRHFQSGWQTVDRGSDVNADVTRTLGVVQTASVVRLYVDAVQQGSDAAGGFDTSWTGWDSVGAGYLEDDKLEGVVGAVVVLPLSAITSSTFKTKLETWGRKWRVAA